MEWIAGGEGRLRVEVLGSGPETPVVLVHGGGADRSHWHALAPLLATDRQIVLFDQRGYGESDPPVDGNYSLGAMASDVVAVANGAGLEAPVVVGHSFGGAVVAAAVGRFPTRFSGAVFLDSAGDIRGLSAAQVAEWRGSVGPDRFRASSRAWFEQILTDARPETRQHVLATLGLTSRETYVGSMEAVLGFDPSVVRRFGGPTLLVTVRSLDGPMGLRAALPELPNVFVEDCSHWPQLDQPGQVADILRPFLFEVDRAGRPPIA
jgi:pimeloyl-ACP methyl ester carboxylesterase